MTICEKIRGFDYFGAPIGLTYHKESTFQTRLGGVVTIMIVIVLGTLVT